MKKSKLLLESEKYHKTAKTIITHKELVATLSKFGSVVFTGAFKYNLMLDPDIDIYVVRENLYSFSEVLEIFNKIVLENKFRSYFIKGNWDDIRIGKTFPNGKYIGFKEKLKNETWKFDIWFISKKELTRLQKFEPENFTLKQKDQILKLKKQRQAKKSKLSGLEIYRKILEKK